MRMCNNKCINCPNLIKKPATHGENWVNYYCQVTEHSQRAIVLLVGENEDFDTPHFCPKKELPPSHEKKVSPARKTDYVSWYGLDRHIPWDEIKVGDILYCPPANYEKRKLIKITSKFNSQAGYTVLNGDTYIREDIMYEHGLLSKIVTRPKVYFPSIKTT